MSVVYETYRHIFAGQDQIDYPWDMWRDTDYFIAADDLYGERIENLSEYASLGVVISIVEWCIARLSVVSSSPDVLSYSNAAWVAMLDRNRFGEIDLPDEDWQGPVRRPLQLGTMFIRDAVFDAQDVGSFVAPVGWARRLAEHIIPEGQILIFREWLEVIVSRMEHYHPFQMKYDDIFQAEFDRGMPLAPDAFIADTEYDPGTNAEKLERHIQSQILQRNRFILEDR